MVIQKYAWWFLWNEVESFRLQTSSNVNNPIFFCVCDNANMFLKNIANKVSSNVTCPSPIFSSFWSHFLKSSSGAHALYSSSSWLCGFVISVSISWTSIPRNSFGLLTLICGDLTKQLKKQFPSPRTSWNWKKLVFNAYKLVTLSHADGFDADGFDADGCDADLCFVTKSLSDPSPKTCYKMLTVWRL